LLRRQSMLVAILRDRLAAHKFHHEVRPARKSARGPRWTLASVEHLSDVWMIHHRQGLPIRLKSGHYVSRVHSRLNNLKCNFPAYWLQLFGKENRPHPALAKLL